MSKSTICARLQRECCDLLPVCHTQHMGAGLAQGPRAVTDYRTNQYVLLQKIYLVSWAGVIIGKQEVCKELCSPEKLHSMQTNEFLESPKPAEAGRDLQACPVQAPLIAGPAGAGYLGPQPAAITRHPAWGCRKGSCRCTGREAGCCCCPAPPPQSTTPASLAFPHPHFCAVMKSSSISPQHQLIPECTAIEPPPGALQPWAALTTGTPHSPTGDCGGPNTPSVSL